MAKNPGRGKRIAGRNNVPDVVGSLTATAQASLTSAGFTSTVTSENTGDSNLNDKIKSQSIAGGTVTPLGTNVSLVRYNFSFTPFGAFGFAPVFGFTPVFSFIPVYQFAPVFIFSPPSCIHENTLIDTPNGKIPAKDISIGDKITSIKINEIPESGDGGMLDFDYVGFVSESLTSVEKTEVTVIDIVASTKNTIYFNNDMSALFSTSQPFFIKRGSTYEIVPSGAIQSGDYLILVKEDGSLNEVEVTQIDYSSHNEPVYQFSCEPQDWFIAGNYLVHNK